MIVRSRVEAAVTVVSCPDVLSSYDKIYKITYLFFNHVMTGCTSVTLQCHTRCRILTVFLNESAIGATKVIFYTEVQ